MHFQVRLGLVIPLLLVLSNFQTAYARWATQEDADSEIEFENSEITVNANGTYSETIESKIRILKDSARDTYATRRITYNSMASEIKVVEAKSILDGNEYPVDSKQMEDKPLASSPSGFDQHNQVLIAFPQVQVGSEIYFKYVIKNKEASIPGFFSTSMVYGTEAYEKSGLVTVQSAIPLHVVANDPSHVLAIKTRTASKDSQFPYIIQVRLTKPVIRIPLDESGVRLDPHRLPWVDISSQTEWAEMARPVLTQYERVLSEPLPPVFEKILNSAKKNTEVLDQINTVTSMLASHVNYLGDWRPISGLYVPRDLKVIADTKLGDCKDFSAATAAILRRLGMKAYIGWVKRGFGVYESPTHLPTLSEFNHAIVHVQKGEKSLWVDPTNFASFAHGTFSDIADRKVLLLDPSHLAIERTALTGPENAQITLSKNIELDGQNQFHVTGKLELKGGAAVPYTGMSLRASKQSIDYSVIKAMGDENRITDWKVDAHDLASRIVHDLEFHFQFIEKNPDLKTSAGSALLLSSGSHIPALLTKTAERVSDLFLGMPLTVKREIQLNKIKKLGTQSLDCSIESPWINASRKLLDTQAGVKVVDALVIKKSLVSNSELHTPTFARLQDNLQKCFNGVAIVYSRDSEASVNR